MTNENDPNYNVTSNDDDKSYDSDDLDTNPEPDESDSEDIITVEDNFDTNKQEPKPVHQIPTLLNPAVTAIFDEFKATKFTSPPDKCHKCAKSDIPSFGETFNFVSSSAERNFETIHDLDKALTETLIRIQCRLHKINTIEEVIRLSTYYSDILKNEEVLWKSRFKESIPSTIVAIETGYSEIICMLDNSVKRMADIQTILKKTDLSEIARNVNAFISEESNDLDKIIKECNIIGGKLKNFEFLYHNINCIMTNVQVHCCSTDDVRLTEPWTEKHGKRINEIQSTVFQNTKDYYFCKWFDQSRVKKAFDVFNSEMMNYIERADNE